GNVFPPEETNNSGNQRKRRRSSGLQTGHSRYKKRLKIAPTVTTSDAGCTKATTNDKSLKTPINANAKAIRSARKMHQRKEKSQKLEKHCLNNHTYTSHETGDN
ncbi:unnamed protein product, partial [Owenia fusiformis]